MTYQLTEKLGKQNMVKTVVFFTIILGMIPLAAGSKGKDFLIGTTDESSIRPYMRQFKEYLNLTNIDKQTFMNIRLKNLYSDNLHVASVSVNGKIYTETKSGDVIAVQSELRSNQKLSIVFTLMVGKNLPDDDTGYHIDNIMAQVYYTKRTNKENGSLHQIIPLAYVKPGCDIRFDVGKNGEVGELPQDHVTASSYYETSPPQEFGEFSDGWCAKDTTNGQYLQILFKRRVRLTFLGIGGRKEKYDWVKKYQLKYKNGDTWYDFKENGFIKTFQGANDIRKSFGWLLVKIHCEGIQIIPRSFVGKLVCLRAAIHGCYISEKGTCFKAIGMQNGKIPKDSLSDAFAYDDNGTTPNNGRLNKVVRNFPFGWRAADKGTDWLQIDLGSLFKVTRVAVQGAYNKPFFITFFSLKYSNDTKNWVTVKRTETEIPDDEKKKSLLPPCNCPEKLQGPISAAEANDGKIVDLPYAVFGRSFRIVPLQYAQSSVLRTELYGCKVPVEPEEHRVNVDPTTTQADRSVLVDAKKGQIYVCQRSAKKTSCFQSEGKDKFQTWRGLPPYISTIVGIDPLGSCYARTKHGSYLLKPHVSHEWQSISNKEWKRHKAKGDLVLSVDLPTIIPNKIGRKYHWNLKTNHTVTVSGIGIHVRYPNTVTWQLKARWACCET